MSTSLRLVLWDVDHTLLESGGVGGEVFAAAFLEATGYALADAAQAQGALEPGLFAAACAANGILDDPASLFPRFAEVQAGLYRDRAADLRERGRVLPGVREILESLASESGVVSTVLSGNTAAAGTAKLEAFGIDGLLDLDVAAWGTDAEKRTGLVPVAWERASEKYGVAFGPDSSIVVGDTGADVSAGLHHGMRVIGVATGRFDVEQLQDAGATVVFEDLAGTKEALQSVLGV